MGVGFTNVAQIVVTGCICEGATLAPSPASGVEAGHSDPDARRLVSARST